MRKRERERERERERKEGGFISTYLFFVEIAGIFSTYLITLVINLMLEKVDTAPAPRVQVSVQ